MSSSGRFVWLTFLASTLACSARTSPGVQHVEPAQERLLGDEMVRVSEHVWAIMGWPNIGVRDRALARRAQHEPVAVAGRALTTEFETRYPDWQIDDLTSFVKAAYEE